MAGLAAKLGIAPGAAVCLLGAPPEAEARLCAEAPAGVDWSRALGRRRYDLIFFWPKRLAGFSELMRRLQRHVVPDGAVWVVMPKRLYAAARGIDFRWEAMQAAALRTDLVDNKIAALDDRDYATRFVIRKDRRPGPPRRVRPGRPPRPRRPA